MTFLVRDLMLNVLPELKADRCQPITNPPPAPCLPPSCAKNSAKAEEDEASSLALAVLREQLHEALRATQVAEAGAGD
jgi:hypothetical protein